MTNEVKMITFDLDDTLWDNKPTINNAEIETRKWIEGKVGSINWGDLNDFLLLREALIEKDKSIAWDISKLRIEIFKEKMKGLGSSYDIQKLAEDAFDFFLKKRHEIKLFPGVEDVIKNLSRNYTPMTKIQSLFLPDRIFDIPPGLLSEFCEQSWNRW